MTQSIQRAGNQAMAEAFLSPEQEQMVRDSYLSGASKPEADVLMEIARARRLNPLLRQVHFVKRWDSTKGRDVWATQVSIDGLRAIAERTGKYDGQDEPEYEYDKNGALKLAKVRVYRKDWSRAAVGIAYWAEYVQTNRDGKPTRFWAQMGHTMLAKCAESLAFRKAFPEDMSGLYTPEEMQQAENDRPRLPRISPHLGPDDDAHPDGHPVDPSADESPAAPLMYRLHDIDKLIDSASSYEEALRARELLGSKAKPGQLALEIQKLCEAGKITPSERSALGKMWQRLDRQLQKRERDLATPIEDSFHDEIREPGEEG